MSIYDQGLEPGPANCVALSPVSFVERSAEVFADLPAVVHGARRYDWATLRDRSARLAAALRSFGIARGCTVSVMLSNTPEMIEAHYAVPALNAVLNTLNTRLDAPLLAWQMNHCEARVLITDREFAPVVREALGLLRQHHGRTPVVIDVCDTEYAGPGDRLGEHEYEALLQAHAPLIRLELPQNEWDAIAVFDAMREHHADHYCAAPIVHNLLIAAAPELRDSISHKVRGMVAGAAPPAAMIEGMARLGFDITHVYGLTEVYGPAAVAVKRPQWKDESLSEQTRLNGRQGTRYMLQEGMAVLDPETLDEMPADGRSMGEIMFRGNLVMKGYLKNEAATDNAFKGGWFHTGDLAVMEPDRYVKIKDRSKDVIISGGENISSIEVEDALYRHPAVMACAVVARADPKWGETPLAYVELKPGSSATAEELIAHCKGLLAGYKVPREVRFEEIPKTSTGKIQKFQLRLRAGAGRAIE